MDGAGGKMPVPTWVHSSVHVCVYVCLYMCAHKCVHLILEKQVLPV